MVSKLLSISYRLNRNRWEPHNPVLPHRHALDQYASGCGWSKTEILAVRATYDASAATYDQDAIVARERDTGRFIEAYTHDVSESLDSALDVEFQIEHGGEWRAEGAPRGAALPLFSALVRGS